MRRATRTTKVATERVHSYADARRLALELAGIAGPHVDAMTAGVVLEPGEVGRRLVGAWLGLWMDGVWSSARWTQSLLSDRRLLVRFDTGELVSLWWEGLVGFSSDIEAGHVVLDFGDGRPRLLSGPGAAVVAVAGVARLYGVEAMLTHPALAPLRQGPLRQGGGADRSAGAH